VSARAWRWQRMLDDGVYPSVSEIGAAENRHDAGAAGAAAADELGGTAGARALSKAADQLSRKLLVTDSTNGRTK
jgi:hypothetical protein